MLYNLRQELLAGIRAATSDAGYDYEVDQSAIELEDITDEEKGEFSSPISFSIAAAAGAPPVDVAETIADAHRSNGLPAEVEAVTVEGGHINYHADTTDLADATLSTILRDGSEYGTRTDADPDTILADVSSPNIAKPLHVGHLRNTILSDAVMNILEARGHDVTRDNHLGDWGVQFGNLMHEYTEFGDEATLEDDAIEHLLDLYQQFEQRDSMLADLEDDETVTDQFADAVTEERDYHADSGKEWFTRLEQGDEDATALWERFRTVSIDRFKQTYDDLDVAFDVWNGESFYAQEGWNDVIIEKAIENDVAMRGEGESVYIPVYPDDYENVGDPQAADVDASLDRARQMREANDDLEDADFDPFYIVKSDGSTLYGTRDLATIEYRIEEYDADQSVYVVANEQNQYFQQLFVAARKMGYNDIKLKHIDYGLISLPEGSMSTRKGQIITAREVLDRAQDRAEEIIAEKGRIDDAEAQSVATKIALATIKYEMVAAKRERDTTFDIDESVALEGDTGPYVQYAATRGYSILDGADAAPEIDDLDPSVFNDTDVELLFELARYPLVLERCEERYDAAPLAHYLLQLAHVFNSFYHKNAVLDAENARTERLLLTKATTQIFDNGLGLLGIDVLEEM
ncbi:arginine--tRNA ligase [Halobacterium salinarum]|uniref:arginine--tRNA ligase n=1 Tax=Halobacterium salinarum TaxID=2242 RepID=UPI001F460AF4|nr:arginine--tRNA ligase [Halobacterium salinarum]MCF2206752.1 arginine--tRNA ligase [Halobacterium salinarum]MCF2240100.1 arginine--tRNA ligase [Halobacterium salinarum]